MCYNIGLTDAVYLCVRFSHVHCHYVGIHSVLCYLGFCGALWSCLGIHGEVCYNIGLTDAVYLCVRFSHVHCRYVGIQCSVLFAVLWCNVFLYGVEW